MNLYIIRHGETDWNKAGKVQGAADISLNHYGFELAEKTREGMKQEGLSFDEVYVSPQLRARQTAETLLKGSDTSFETDARIREMEFGEYEGTKITEIHTNPEYRNMFYCFKEPVSYHADRGAESFELLHARAEDFLKEKVFPYRDTDKNILLVCHGAISRALIGYLKKQPLENFWGIEQYNCCVNKIHFTPDRMEFEFINKLYYEKKEELSQIDRMIRS